MLALLLALSLGQNTQCWKQNGALKCASETQRPQRVQRASTRVQGRGSGAPGAFFEFAPASGAGLSAACACTAVTGAKGEAITWTRLAQAYCTKEGMATTGLTTTSMVYCGNNLPRVERSADGILGIRVEPAMSNICLRSEEFDNATTWTSTAAVTPNTTTSPANSATADTLTDASGAAIQSSCQTIASTSAVRFTFSAYLTAGTLAKASVRMTGTGSSTGDCVTSTTTLDANYTRLTCSSPAAYAGTLTAITVCVEVGTVVADTGTIIAWGAQLETALGGTAALSYMPTAAGVTNKAAEQVVATPDLSGLVASGCAAGTFQPFSATAADNTIDMLVGGNVARYLYLNQTLRIYDGTTEQTLSAGYVAGTPKRYRSTWSGATEAIFNVTDATTNSGAFDGTMTGDGTLRLAGGIIGAGPGILSRVQLDPNPARCQ